MILYVEVGPAEGDSVFRASLDAQSHGAWSHHRADADSPLAGILDKARSADAAFVAFSRPSFEMKQFAVEVVDEALDRSPLIDVLYADEVGVRNGAAAVRLKPGWSPERFEAQDYLGETVWYSTRVLQRLPETTPVAQVRGRAIQNADTIAHLPVVVGSSDAPAPSVTRVARSAFRQARASIIIPTAAGHKFVEGESRLLVRDAVESVLRLTKVEGVEVILVEDRSCDPGDLRFLRDYDQVRIVKNLMPFNFSKACNLGASHAQGEVLVFLNDDTRCLEPDWLTPLISYCTASGVGAVGPQLLYEDRRIQHAGIWARDGIPGHRYSKLDPHFVGIDGALTLPQNCLAVTGACLAVEARKFHAVGGFDPRFPANFNDVDLCLRLLQRGWRTVVEPTRSFLHFESATRTPAASNEEYERLEAMWGDILRDDFWDNPGHVAPAPNEYPAPVVSFMESRQAATQPRPQPRIWDVGLGRPSNYAAG